MSAQGSDGCGDGTNKRRRMDDADHDTSMDWDVEVRPEPDLDGVELQNCLERLVRHFPVSLQVRMA